MDTKAMQDDPDWDPTYSTGYFHGVLECPRTPCGNNCIVAGSWKADYVDDVDVDPVGQVLDDYLSVNYVFPALPLMEYPDGVPDRIRDPISAASMVILSDASAAANRIRSAIEALLDCQNVRKLQAGKRTSRLKTHARIELYMAKNPRAAAHLMAMKWIGNVGSHERDPLPLSMVLDGMEHFAKAVELIYDRHEKALERRAVQINQLGHKLRAPKAKA
ncbi:MAG: DUF4145 domain-containing protein [Streptosporangiaceae bacterium]